MFAHTDIKQAPWYVVDADDKKRARLNCIRHLLSLVPYEDLTPGQMASAGASAAGTQRRSSCSSDGVATASERMRAAKMAETTTASVPSS
jgi:hypothetical protein